MRRRGKPGNVATIAVARELAGFSLGRRHRAMT
jgi:hypothetical protein